MGPLQFGVRKPGRDYPDRPAAFAVIPRGEEVALVRVETPEGGFRIDLPGGGLEGDEDAGQAAIRETGEEAGLRTADPRAFLEADQYFENGRGETHNLRCTFVELRAVGEAPDLKVEEDHTLIWRSARAAVFELTRDSHAWALAAWLRRGGSGAA